MKASEQKPQPAMAEAHRFYKPISAIFLLHLKTGYTRAYSITVNQKEFAACAKNSVNSTHDHAALFVKLSVPAPSKPKTIS